MTEPALTLEMLAGARNYLDVFGPCEPGVEPEAHIKKAYRRLALKVHPDKYSSTADKELAQEAFKILGDLLTKANRAASEGRYGEIPRVVIRARKADYEVGDLQYKGEIADLYVTKTTSGRGELGLLKIARLPRDNELMATEARVLRKLWEDDATEFQVFFPRLYDTFVYRDDKSVERRANVLERLDGWYSLEEVRQHYPEGVAALDMVWIWRRVLWLLGYAHSQGILHDAIWPSHVLIQPTQHGVMLVDWCYSQTATDGAFTPIRVVSGQYQDWYPQEVSRKDPPTTATDIYMAAKSMVYLMGGESVDQLGDTIPRAFKAFFVSCLEGNQRVRPGEAWELLAETDELLMSIGEPYFPRRFREFVIPAR